MTFIEILPFILNGKIVKIKDVPWILKMSHDDNLMGKTIYIIANELSQAWNPQELHLLSKDWEVVNYKDYENLP